jgi:hypothetical protein
MASLPRHVCKEDIDEVKHFVDDVDKFINWRVMSTMSTTTTVGKAMQIRVHPETYAELRRIKHQIMVDSFEEVVAKLIEEHITHKGVEA